MAIKKLLKKYFGYDSFRPLQKEIINNVLDKQDSFVLMPTGGGKSLCYQLPALQFEGLTLVISPLIALMKDQVDTLKANGIEAEFINSSLSRENLANVKQKILNEQVKILYVAPERLALASFQQFLGQIQQVSLIAIDEAHCISEWGHDFRPEYRNLKNLKLLFPDVPIIALTATATLKVRKDILNQLNIKEAKTFVSSFDRPNLKIKVLSKQNSYDKIFHLLKKYKGESVIIYCFSRKDTEHIAESLKADGFSALAYHAGLNSEVRKKNQELFVKDEVDIIVATLAFGMGIDKPDVRMVIHHTFPKTLESYYQEIGRAGRDSLDSECVLLYSLGDKNKHEFFHNEIANSKELQVAKDKLEQMIEFCQIRSCRKKYILNYFGEELKSDNCGACDICLTEDKIVDATIITQKILSAVIRLKNSWGKSHVVKVLRGSNCKKVKELGHHKLSVFGIVKNYSDKEVKFFIDQLIGQNLLKIEGKQFPLLKITQQGLTFLKNREKIKLAVLPDEEILPEKSKQVLDFNQDLFEKLRVLRKNIAEKANIPPFIVFGDKTLQEMAYYLPMEEFELGKISGVGQQKLQNYGPDFLELIKKFVRENNLTPIKIKQKQPSKRKMKRDLGRYQITKKLIKEKLPLEEVARRQDFTKGTIVRHLQVLMEEGCDLSWQYLLPSEKICRKVLIALEQNQEFGLKAVYQSLDEKISYETIRLVRLMEKNNE